MAVKARMTIGITENGVDSPEEAVMLLIQAEFIRAWMTKTTLPFGDVADRIQEGLAEVNSCFTKLVATGVIIRGDAPAGESNDEKYYRPAKSARFYVSVE